MDVKGLPRYLGVEENSNGEIRVQNLFGEWYLWRPANEENWNRDFLALWKITPPDWVLSVSKSPEIIPNRWQDLLDME